MNTKGIKFLKEHESKVPSKFEEDVLWRTKNEAWLRKSRKVALTIIDYMQQNNISRTDLAHKLGVTPQYVSKILSGTVNFSFKTIADLEAKLNIQFLEYA